MENNLEKFIKKHVTDIRKIEYVVFETKQHWDTILKYADNLNIPRIHYFKLPKILKGVLINNNELWFRWKFKGKDHVCKLILTEENEKLMTRVD